jgi:hypothetical protein
MAQRLDGSSGNPDRARSFGSRAGKAPPPRLRLVIGK